jgi:hypothetical protein
VSISTTAAASDSADSISDLSRIIYTFIHSHARRIGLEILIGQFTLMSTCLSQRQLLSQHKKFPYPIKLEASPRTLGIDTVDFVRLRHG